jgi:protein-L-isoaspartate(D-aspartate) O-methyltransferase
MPDIDAASHMATFLAMLDSAFRRYGVTDGLPPVLRDAVQAVPRHRFVHRYSVGDGPLQVFEDDPTRHLATIYSDQVMRHVDAAGELLPSSNSQPSYVLWLLHCLDLQPGHRVLEIGSGSGWLAAIMAKLVGPGGHVTGIEIIADLAEQSRHDLLAMGLHTVEVIVKDGTAGHAERAPFDRAMITAGTWQLPVALFDQVADGGAVLVPLELRGGAECQVTALRHRGGRFVAERSVYGQFVPLLGAGQDRSPVRRRIESLPFWPEIATPCLRCALPLGGYPGGAGPLAALFRAFLGRTEPGFTVFETGIPKEHRGWLFIDPFGLVDEAEKSVAVCQAGELIGYGNDAVARRLLRAFAQWEEYGLPGMAAFELEIVRRADQPEATAGRWIEERGDTVLVWRLPEETRAWRSYL